MKIVAVFDEDEEIKQETVDFLFMNSEFYSRKGVVLSEPPKDRKHVGEPKITETETEYIISLKKIKDE